MAASLASLVAGCAPLAATPAATPAPRSEALAYWSRAVDADDSRRGALVAEAQRSKSAWKLAMLRSLPGATDAGGQESAHMELRSLLRQGLPEDEAALTRLRLAELEQAGACSAEVGELRGRIGRIVEIERQIEHGR